MSKFIDSVDDRKSPSNRSYIKGSIKEHVSPFITLTDPSRENDSTNPLTTQLYKVCDLTKSIIPLVYITATRGL